MNKIFLSPGILVRRMNFGEADQLLTVLTPERGKVPVLAKGSRKLKSRFCGRLELGNQIEMEAVEGRTFYYLNEVSVTLSTKHPPLGRHGALFFACEALCLLLPEGQDARDVYALTAEFLTLLQRGAPQERLLCAWLIQLLTRMGFMAPWNQCPTMDRKLDLSLPVYQSEEGYLTHRFSVTKMPLSPTLIKWVNFIQHQPLARGLLVTPYPHDEQKAWQMLSSQLERLVSRPLRSGVLLKTI